MDIDTHIGIRVSICPEMAADAHRALGTPYHTDTREVVLLRREVASLYTSLALGKAKPLDFDDSHRK